MGLTNLQPRLYDKGVETHACCRVLYDSQAVAVKEDGGRPIPQPAGKEAVYTRPCGKYPGGRCWYIFTLSDIGSMCSIVGLVFAVFAFVWSNRNEK